MGTLGRAIYSVGFWIRETGQALDRLGCRLQGNYYFQEQLSRHRTLMNVFDKAPAVDKDAFVAPNASIIGNVHVGRGSSIWYGCVLRGDVNSISVGSGTNIQDNSLVHVAKSNLSGKVLSTIIGDNVTVGHSAVLHGCTVEDEAFVGAGATLLDGVCVEKNAMVAAGALVRQNTRIPCGENLSVCRGYNFSHFLPTINISNSDLCSSLVSSSLDLNLQTVDLLSTSTCDGATSSSQSSENTLDHFMRELKDSPSNSYNKKSTFEDGYGRKKRPNSVSQSNNFLAEAKKNRTAPRSCLTLKVRKEKLGDRIAALQWLVAPYGKTDTASVLTEAIGYIQFLHDQVQTLCAPHMKSSDIKPTRTAQACSSEEDGKGQQKRDLRSRGLCLVPLSCVSFFRTCDGGIERSPRKGLKMAYEKEI